MSIVNKIARWIEKCSSNKYKKKIIGSVVILAAFAIFLVVGYNNSKPVKITDGESIFKQEDYKEEQEKGEGMKGSSGDITVYINGEVKNPGIYKLKSDSRIGDLIKTSGGFKDDADTYKINLAKKLKDEDYIYIDKIQKEEESGKSVGVEGKSGLDEDGVVNINTASIEELKTIPGVGDITAQNIIDYREQNGDFSSKEDIKNVDRIGDKTFEKMKDKIDVR
ncbi:helix-hairpin-helix domain-containing protein [Clostridium sp. LBM24168]